jgi:hypothetical protein
LIEIGLLVLKEKILKFSLFCYYLPFGKSILFHTHKLESAFPKRVVLSFVKTGQVVSGDDGRSEMLT